MRSITYCSFANSNGCLGVVILDGDLDVIEAAKEAHRLNLNPGGQVLAVSCSETDSDVPGWLFEAMWNNKNRLITSDEARVLFDAIPIKEHNGSLN